MATKQKRKCTCCPHYGRNPPEDMIQPNGPNGKAALICPKCDRA